MYDGYRGIEVAIDRVSRAEVRLPNGTWRTTYPNRLDDINEWLLEYLTPTRCLQIMDVAISSGISTLEWGDQLSAHGVRHQIVAGDLITEGRVVGWAGRMSVMLDSRDNPLLLELGLDSTTDAIRQMACQSDPPSARAAPSSH